MGFGTPVYLGSTQSNNDSLSTKLRNITVPAGSLIVVYTFDEGGWSSSGSVDDSAGNSWHNPTSFTDDVSYNTYGIWYARNSIALSGTDYIHYQGSADVFCYLFAFYVPGALTTSSALDSAATATNSGDSSRPNVTSGTPATAGDMFWAYVGTHDSSVCSAQATGWSNPSGYNPVGNPNFGGYLINPSTSPQTYSVPSMTGGSDHYGAAIVAFRPGPFTDAGMMAPMVL